MTLDSATYFEYMDKYCERTAEGMWAEPLNVISNIVFLAVAVQMFRLYREKFHGYFLKNWDISLLIFLLFCITIGSTLWHVFAVRVTLYADAIPILLFINLYLVICFVRMLRLRVIWVVVFFCLYQLFNYLVQRQFSMNTLNGSIFYTPVYLYLVGILFYVCLKRAELCRYFLMSVVLFSVALVLRTLDLSQCEEFPIGTHFMWHTLIAGVLYLLTKSLLLTQTTHARSTHD